MPDKEEVAAEAIAVAEIDVLEERKNPLRIAEAEFKTARAHLLKCAAYCDKLKVETDEARLVHAKASEAMTSAKAKLMAALESE